MKIRSVGADNRSFHITTYRGEFSFPFSKANPKPTTRDPINRLYVDPEIRNQGFTYILKSGKEGTVLVDQVLDFNRDPIYMRRAAAYWVSRIKRQNAKLIREIDATLRYCKKSDRRIADLNRWTKRDELKRLTKTLQQAVPEARASQREGIEELKGALAGDVWDDLTDTHEEAQNLRARSRLMCQITDAIGTRGWTKAEAAAKCGITQVRVNDLLRGRISQFSLDDLANIAAALIRSRLEPVVKGLLKRYGRMLKRLARC